ncbi:hypothetical protein KIN20_030975 [Parelaphostrongylus tenuis]|uniref:Uncharacterized protein n=1 Tax=Parelaphostrongylus tenuis TaxID=148309 RepID=A0AAD5WGI3_PARTN|nr:hypothetical protein KIN20_030975 [Parelaphostrongylus tenuis]
MTLLDRRYCCECRPERMTSSFFQKVPTKQDDAKEIKQTGKKEELRINRMKPSS